jgi:beta-lactamase class A
MNWQSSGKKPNILTGILKSLSGVLIACAFGLGIMQWLAITPKLERLPAGSTIGGIPVGGMSIEDARQELESRYLSPLVLEYDGAQILVSAQEIGLELNFSPSLTEIRNDTRFDHFWRYLWQKEDEAYTVEIVVQADTEKIELFLQNEVSLRYDVSAVAPVPILGTTRFFEGRPGKQLNISASVGLILAEIASLESRPVDLVVEQVPIPPASYEHLEVFLKQKLIEARFNGIAEIYVQDLDSGQKLHFAVRNGIDFPENIAFSAASTIKIPILLSSVLRVDEPLPNLLAETADRMIVYSENPPADRLMESIIDSTLAPLKVTEDMQALGLENTFLAGYFYLGAPLLQRFETPANSRTDIQLRPDIYNQTTVGDMGKLLAEIYICANENRGLLIDTFGSEISPSKCAYIIDVLSRNKIGILSEAGVPEGTIVAHKHGWTEESDGYIHTISDVGILYTPGTDYVLIVFLYDPIQLLFNPGNELVAQISQVVYNFFNPAEQIDWAFGAITYR